MSVPQKMISNAEMPHPEEFAEEQHALVKLRGLTKRFPGVIANDQIDMDLFAGEIHTLLGENGAGKTTLLNILSGIHPPDEGTIEYKEEIIHLRSPHQALIHGIGTVYQHFTLVPNLSVAENVFLGMGKGLVLRLEEAEIRIKEMMDKFELHIDPWIQVQHLSLGQQQRVEIIKVLFRDPEILLLDEPTSVLTPTEIKELFHMLKQLKIEGKGIVFISHKLHEALELSDRISILRDGKKIAQFDPLSLKNQDKEITSTQIVKQMFGSSATQEMLKRNNSISNTPTLLVENLTVKGSRGEVAVKHLSFGLHAGEVLGLAGVGGSGQKELAEAIAGQIHVNHGRIQLNEVELTNLGVRYAMHEGIAYITDDRIEEGTVSDLYVAENAVMRIVDEEPISRGSFLNWRAIFDHTKKLIEDFNIKAHSPKVRTGTLSGGNIQKLLLARELSRAPKVLVCNQPTYGLDVKTAQFVWRTLLEQASNGIAILLISSDLDEIFDLSDRIGVMYNGELLAVLPKAETDRETIGRLMLGKKE